jgi:hypothetical protein
MVKKLSDTCLNLFIEIEINILNSCSEKEVSDFTLDLINDF